MDVHERVISVTAYFYQGMMATVRSSGQVSNPFSDSNETKQCSVLAPLLFVLYFAVMLETAFENVKEGMRFEFKRSGELFNQQHIKARTKNCS